MQDKYTLTFPQQNIWFVDNLHGNSLTNLIVGVININKGFNGDFCIESINGIIKNNDAMRVNIILDNSVAYQIVNKYQYENIDIIDMQNFSNKEKEEYIYSFKSKEINIKDKKLYKFEILKFSETSGAVLLKMHHIISDAWSYSKIIEQFIENYSFLENKEINNDNNIPSYIDFVNLTNEYKNSNKYLKDELFFDEYLKNVSSPVVLKEKSIKISNKSKRYNVKLEQKLNDKILEYCKNNKVSPYVLFLTALCTYIYRIKDNNDFVIGTPSLNRANFKEKQMIGMFVATLPLRVKIEENIKFLDLAHSISSNVMGVFRHQRYPYTNILKKVRSENNTSNNLYSLVLSYQNARANYTEEGKYSTKWYPNEYQHEDLLIHVLDMDNTGILEINYDYLSDLFEDIEIKYLHTRLMAIIENAVSDENVDVENIEIMSKEEKDKILYEFNNTKCDYPKDKSVIDLFEEQVEKTPDNVAIVFEGKKLTYKELNEKANAVARYLNDIGIAEGDNLAILMKKSDKLMILLLAILKCRAVYIPLDVTYPKERIEYILNSCSSKIVLIENQEFDYINNVIIDEKKMNEIYVKYSYNNLNIKITSNNQVNNYIIYTSGSTGNPKGVAITCENLLNFVKGINKKIGITSDDNVVSITTISFDIFGLEAWVTLTSGATLVLANYIQSVNGNELNVLCINNKVNVIQTTPTKLKLLLDSNNNMFIKQMTKIILGGEHVANDFVDEIKSITDSKIYDAYGPTETTIWSTIKDITKCKVIAGKPIDNTNLYIMDKKNRLLPIKTNGQLAISGDSVSPGYINNKEATTKSFVYNNNFKKVLYYTGDYCYINFNGNLKVLDRIDLQTKVNGQRIELQEIEKAICEYENVSNCIVSLKDNILVCFYTKEKDSISFDKNEITKYLYTKLPTYMIPKEFYFLKELPLTFNGKIDRKKINSLEVKKRKENKYMEPTTNIQKSIYGIWKKVINDRDFGVNDPFFELGTDSLDAIKIQIELLKIGIKIEYQELFKYPTIIDLERKINNENFDIVEKEKELGNTDYNSILEKNKEKHLKVVKQDVGNILITGVTGFLGAHVLDEYLKSQTGKVYCIVRDKGQEKYYERLKNRLNFYFGNKYDKYLNSKIIPVNADITNEDNFGMNKEEFYQIINDVDAVIHCAACVKHYGFASLFKKINIDGTEIIAKLCYENNKKLIHISTISVSGNAFETFNLSKNNNEETIFDETCFYKKQNLNNIYVYTKFKAEQIVLEYMKKGLNANIVRVGNLTNRFNDMKFQYNDVDNAFLNRIKTFLAIKKFPINNSNMYLEFTPVDLTAQGIIKILEYFNNEHNMFHLYDNKHIYFDRFINILNSININIELLSQKEFSEVISQIANSDNKDILKGIINDLDENNNLNYNSSVKVKCDYTVNYLESIGFEWPEISDEYVIKYIKQL